jgi:hypothetical protein
MRCSGASGRLAPLRVGSAQEKLPRIRHVLLDDLGVGIIQDPRAARRLDELRRPLDHAVTLTGLPGFDFARRRHLEALFGARFGFHFWHFEFSLFKFAHGPYRSFALASSFAGPPRGRRLRRAALQPRTKRSEAHWPILRPRTLWVRGARCPRRAPGDHSSFGRFASGTCAVTIVDTRLTICASGWLPGGVSEAQSKKRIEDCLAASNSGQSRERSHFGELQGAACPGLFRAPNEGLNSRGLRLAPRRGVASHQQRVFPPTLSASRSDAGSCEGMLFAVSA